MSIDMDGPSDLAANGSYCISQIPSQLANPKVPEDGLDNKIYDLDGSYLVHEGELDDEEENHDPLDVWDLNRWDIDYPEESSSDEDANHEESESDESESDESESDESGSDESESDEKESKENKEANPIKPRVGSMKHKISTGNKNASGYAEQSRKQVCNKTGGKPGARQPYTDGPQLLDIGGVCAPGVRSTENFTELIPKVLETGKGFVEPYPSIKFANLKDLATKLSLVLEQPDQPSEIRHCDYPGAIKVYGGAAKLIDDTLSCVDPEILMLQGKYLSTQRLFVIQSRQIKTSPRLHDRWPRESGYLDFVTDYRNDKYIRFYVGQSGNVLIRLSDHFTCIVRGDCHTLHYYILQLGNGQRRANFLRLWVIPNGMTSEPSKEIAQVRTILLQNFLEMLFCAAFHSLPKETLEPSFGVSPSGRALDISLNILPPLLQDQSMSVVSRSHYRNRLFSSPDAEIQSWPDVRNKQLALHQSTKKLKTTQLRPSTSKETLLESLKTLAETTGSSNSWKLFTDSLHLPNPPVMTFDLETELGLRFPEDSLCVHPKGTMQSSVGIVLDNMAFNAETSVASMPSILESVGFHGGNCMTWTYNHTPFGILDTESLDPHDLATNDISPRRSRELSCNGFTKFLLSTCSFRVILLCGALSELQVRSALELGESNIMQLRGEDVRVWVRQHLNGWQVLFSTPEPFALGLRQMSEQIIVLGEIFKAAGILSGLQLDFHFFERKNAYSLIFQQMALEKEDRSASIQMTASNLDQKVRNFLFRRGFEETEDLIKLEAINGSLASGICMLGLFCFPRKTTESSRGPSRAPTRRTRPSSKEGRVPFSEEQKNAVRALYAQVMRKKDKKCSVRPPSKSFRDSEAIDALQPESSQLHTVPMQNSDDVENVGSVKSHKPELPHAIIQGREEAENQTFQLHNVPTQNSAEEEDLDALDLELFNEPESESESPQIAAHAIACLQEHNEIGWCESSGLGTTSSIQACGRMKVAISSSQGLIKTISSQTVKQPGINSIVPLKRGISDEDIGIRRHPQTTLDIYRATSDNPYLRTATPGPNPIQTQCYKCGTLIGEDKSPSYTTLPPFRGFYLAPETLRCPAEGCQRHSSAVPVDPSIEFVRYTDIAYLKRKKHPIYKKLSLIICEGDTSVFLSPEELDMPNHGFLARKQRKVN